MSAEVSFHMARPATVLSNNSSTSSPATANNSALNASNNSQAPSANSPNKNSTPPNPSVKSKSYTSTTTTSAVPAENAGNMNTEWTSLVDTATKAIYDNVENGNLAPNDEKKHQAHARSINVNGEVNEQDVVKSLQDRIAALEDELRQEKTGKSDLEHQIEQLKDENARLKEESQTAAQQLRRFTEWFFQTIDKS